MHLADTIIQSDLVAIQAVVCGGPHCVCVCVCVCVVLTLTSSM